MQSWYVCMAWKFLTEQISLFNTALGWFLSGDIIGSSTLFVLTKAVVLKPSVSQLLLLKHSVISGTARWLRLSCRTTKHETGNENKNESFEYCYPAHFYLCCKIPIYIIIRVCNTLWPKVCGLILIKLFPWFIGASWFPSMDPTFNQSAH